MAWRAINDTVNESLTLAELSDFSERLFWRLVAHADPWGRLAGDAAKVRARCCALLNRPDEEIATALDELESTYRIFRYEAEGTCVLEITDWEQNQPKDVLGRGENRFKSRFPAPPGLAARRDAAQSGGVPAESESEVEEQIANAISSTTSQRVGRIYAHWRDVRKKTDPRYNRLIDSRRSKIVARLRDGFTEEQLIEALDAVANDPWEERWRHDDIATLFKSAEAVDRFLAFGDKKRRKAAAGCTVCGMGGGEHVAGCASANGHPEKGQVADGLPDVLGDVG